MIVQRTVFALVCFVLVACDGDGIADPTEFDQSCGTDADCAVVGTDCCCGSGAVNVSERERYEEERGSCGGDFCASSSCAQVIAFCNQGTCAISTP